MELLGEINNEAINLTEEELIRHYHFPAALAKAVVDPFDYALGLRNGSVLLFDEACYRPGSEWVHITLHPMHGELRREGRKELLTYPFERGVDIRLSEIAWVADAPFGS